MSVTGFCEHCGAALPPRAPAGLCPKCLLGQAVKAAPESAGATQADAGRAGPGLQRLGDYELLEKIATGGMGVVYKARQVSLNRTVALKMMPPGRLDSGEAIARFQAEAEAVASLQHPRIVAIHETGQWEDQHYFSMDYVAGENLAEAVRLQPLPPVRAARVLKAVAEAVHYAHQKGILHRDLKPSNIILDEAGEPHVTDFGLAKRLGGDSALTLTGQVIGSPGFMPPEQAGGQQTKPDVRSDVYGLGAILYYVLAGRPPFQADTLTMLLKQVIETEPVQLRLLNPSIPHDLENICHKCLEKEPLRRYTSAQDLAEDLGRFLNGQPVRARPVGPAGKAWRWCRRNPSLTAAVGLAVLSLLAGLAGVLWQWGRAKAERARAEAGEYAADMHLAQLALGNNNRQLAWGLLNKHRPGGKAESRKQKAEVDLRGWEWRYLWELCQGDESSTLYRPQGSVRALAVSKDGKLLAVATASEVTLWNPATRQQLTGFRTQASGTLAFSPTEDLLAVGGRARDGQPAVELWDLKARAIVRTLKHKAKVQSLAFSPDGQLLATLDFLGNLQVVDWQSEEAFTNLPAGLPSRYSSTGALAFSPQGRRLAVGEAYGRTRVHDLHTGTTVFLETLSVGVNALTFSPDGDMVAAGYGYGNGALSLCDARTGTAFVHLTNHTSDVRALLFTPDGSQLASASNDGTIRIWNVAERTQANCLRSSPGGPTALAMLPDGRTLISGRRGAVCFWDAAASNRPPAHTQLRVSAGFASFAPLDPSSSAPGRLDPKVVRRSSVAFTPDSRRFLVLDTNGAIALWNVHPAQRIEPLPALGSNHWGVALSPNGRWLATGDCVGTVTIWDWPDPTAVTRFSLPFEWCGTLRVSRSGHFLMAGTMDNEWGVSFRIRRTADWSEVPLTGTQSAGLWTADISPDDRFVAAGYADGKVKLFRNPSGEPEATLTGHTAPVVAVCFSPDGRSLVSASMDGSARLWDVVSRRELTRLPAGGAFGAALSPDGRRLAVGSSQAVKVWDFVGKRELLTLAGGGQWFFDLKFSPDGNTLAATSFAGMAHLWHAPSREEIEEAEKEQKAR